MRIPPIRAAVLGLSAMMLAFLSLAQAADSDRSKTGAQESSSFSAGYQDGLRQGLSAARGSAQAEAAATATKVEDDEDDGGGCG